MADGGKRGAKSKPLGARVRSALGQVREQGAASLRGVRRTVAEAGERIKHTQAAERLGTEVETRRVIRKAAEAQQRGNHAMAYRLLEPEVRDKPDDVRVAVAFWRAAVACERAEEAVAPLLHAIRALAGAGEVGRAAPLWVELRAAIPSVRLEPSSLVRIASALIEGGGVEHGVQALRDAVETEDSGLSPGLAVRIAEMAHDLDPATAHRAAQRALSSPDLHESKRARLHGLVVALERREAEAESSEAPPPAASEAAPAGAEPAPDAAPVQEASGARTPGAAIDATLEALAPALRFGEIKVREGMPTRFGDEALSLQLQGGRKARIEYAAIQALAVAEVQGLAAHPVVIVDLVLNWSESEDPILRVVRLRSDGFDPRMVYETAADRDEAFRAFLAELLARCEAVPLPDAQAALAEALHRFGDLDAYQRHVLQVGS